MFAACTHFGEASNRQRRDGFTLIETALATIIIGVAVLAIMAAQQAFHKQNAWSSRVSIAMALAHNIREATWDLAQHDPVTGCTGETHSVSSTLELNEDPTLFSTWDDLDDFDLVCFNPPINARRDDIANMQQWWQCVSVFDVNPFNINEIETLCTSDVMKVQVEVYFQGSGASTLSPDTPLVTTVSWIAPNH